jgi:hypothetical protein
MSKRERALVSIEIELLLEHKNKRFVYCTVVLFNL